MLLCGAVATHFIKPLATAQEDPGQSLYSLLLLRVIRDNVVLIARALRHHFVIPQWGEFCSHVEDFYWACKALKGGHVSLLMEREFNKVARES